MENIRCLITDIDQQILSDIVHHIAGASPGVDVVARDKEHADLPELVKTQGIDVLIIGMDDVESPTLFSQVFEVKPELVIVGLTQSGRRATIYVDQIDPELLVDAMFIGRHRQ